MWDLKPISVYTLCSNEKNHVFSMYDKNHFGLHSIFSMWDLKPFHIYTLCSHEKNHVFSMWDKKPFGLKRIIYYLFNVGFETLSYIYSMFP